MDATFRTDQPIESADEDTLGRTAFAGIISVELLDRANAGGSVTAIEGPWGSGKSSLLNLIQYQLQNECSNVIIVNFNPWAISGAHDLILSFLLELNNEISSAAPRSTQMVRQAGRAIRRYSKYLSLLKNNPEPVLGWLGSVIAKLFNDSRTQINTIEACRAQVDKKLNALNSPIFVFIDDLDRMTPAEVTTMYQLLKAVANFKKITYVLAYDRAQLENLSQLSSHLSDSQEGPLFLDKVVGLSYGLPPLTSDQRREYFITLIDELKNQISTPLSQFEIDRIPLALDKGILAAIRSPRDAKRLYSRARLSTNATRDEVNFADVIAFEAIGVRFPEIERMIRGRPLTWCAIMEDADTNVLPSVRRFVEQDQVENKSHDLLTKLTASYRNKSALPGDVTEADILESLLTFLFPQRFSERVEIAELESELRIGSIGPLLQLLTLSSQTTLPSSRLAKKFLKFPETRAQIMEQCVVDNSVDNLLSGIGAQSRTQDITDVPDIAEWLCEGAVKIFEETGVDIAKQVSEFVIKVSAKNGNDAEIAALLRRLAQNKRYLGITELVLSIAIGEHGEFPGREDRAIDEQDRLTKEIQGIRDAISTWLTTVRDFSRENPLSIIQSVNAAGILYRWGQFQQREFQEPQNYISQLIAQPPGANAFLNVFAGWGAHMGIKDLLADPAYVQERLEEAANQTDDPNRYSSLLTAIENAKKDTESNGS